MKRMTGNRRWKRLGFAVLGAGLVFHFSLAAVSAANMPISKPVLKLFKNSKTGQSIARFLVVYQYLTGTGNCFGFFAPGVISQIKVGYEIRHHGKVVEQGIVGSENAEVSLRMHNLTQQFWTASLNPKVRRSMAASFAGKLFSQHPSADSVSISLKSFVLPSMAQYREGMRPSWEKNYSSEFTREPGA